MKTIDDVCIWKEIEQDPKSSTFQDVRRLTPAKIKAHPLYPCIICDGYSYACSNYRDASRYKGVGE